jgi:Uncharacterised nucleotidyltransferase
MSELLADATKARKQPEVELLLCCARTKLTPRVSTRIRATVQNNLDWMALIRLGLRHNVMPLLYRNLQRACPDAVPAQILAPLRARYESQAKDTRRLAEELVRILPALEAAGVLAVPWKGPTLAQRLYGNPFLRESGDLDIMVLARDVAKAQEIIRGFGYEFSYLADVRKLADDVRNRRELLFHRSDGALLELQWRFASRLACVKNDPDRFLQRFEPVSVAGVTVRSLPLETYLLILPIHATKHKWGQLKLICDIAELLNHSELDWRYVLREARDLGLRRMIEVGVVLAETLLDAEVPGELARGLSIGRTTRALAREVCAGLFKEKPKNWRGEADFPFQLNIRERLRDRTSMLSRNLPLKLRPNDSDREFLPMPKFLFPLSYFVRPVRLTLHKMGIHTSHPST